MIAGEKTPVLDQCLTCYACNEICPQAANPFDLIAALQENKGLLISPVPEPANSAPVPGKRNTRRKPFIPTPEQRSTGTGRIDVRLQRGQFCLCTEVSTILRKYDHYMGDRIPRPGRGFLQQHWAPGY